MIRSTAAMVAVLLCGVTTAEIINVPADYTTIQAAVNAASNGDEILVAPGTYTGGGAIVVHTLGKAITLRASGTAEETILDGQGVRQVVVLEYSLAGGTVIEGFTITGGFAEFWGAPHGGGIYCTNGGTITDCTIINNTAEGNGGGIYAGGITTITDCTIINNTAKGNGGGIYCTNGGIKTITGCTISGNIAAANGVVAAAGGGVYCAPISDGDTTITNCMISGNTANEGGGIYNGGTWFLSLIGTAVCENAPDQVFGGSLHGDGVCLATYCTDSDDDGILDECDDQVGDGIHEVPSEFEHIAEAVAAANDGDTVLVAPGTYTSSGGWVINPSGKAITIRATGTAEETILDGEGSRRVVQCAGGEGPDTVIEGFTITGGSADNGGGIYCDSSTPTITDCTITGNTAMDDGGGIYCKNSSNPVITNCTISDNTATSGGGIYCYESSSPTITGCTISDNTAEGASWGNLGGGIYSGGSSDPTITDCTISNNTANNYGGGIYCFYSSPTITDCTISNNTANNSGGGIYSGGSSDPTITDCTISNNTAGDDAGGIYCYSSSPTITGCTISDNTATSGGGIYCYESSSPTITGCTISNNTANNYGGGVYCDSSSSTITDTNVCGNDADQIYGPWIDGGGVCVSFSCDDSDGDGTPDKCQGSIGDGIHEVPSEYATVQAAIEAAGYGDTVLVAPGTYTSSGGWVINPSGKAITIRATGTAEETILDGEGSRRAVQCTGGEGPDTVIEGFTITGGSADNGGGIYCYYSSPTITGCTISGNTATSGGGIYCDSSTPTITGCTISNNTATSGGGIYCDSSTPTITDCTISNNTATSGGGIYCDSSTPTITGCTISGNMASSDGGGIYYYSSSPTITGCTISNNTANSQGGGIYCDSSPWGYFHTISGCEISNNTASSGGGISCDGYSSPKIFDCSISGNTASNSGGGIYCYSSSNPTLKNTVVCSNAPDNIFGSWTDGGGTCVAYYCTDSDDDGILDECDDQVGDGIHEVPSEFEHIAEAVAAANDGDTVLVAPGTYTGTGDEVVDMLGRAITIRATGTPEETIIDGEGARRVVLINSGEGADTVIEGFTITGGSADNGGGIYCYSSSPTITDCTISDNTAEGNGGGGIYCSGGSPTITDCTISGNTANNYGGGGIYCSGGSPTITGCTISGNTANNYGGGGIYCNYSSPTITGCTISGNTANNYGGGGIYCNYSSPTITGCTISGNTANNYGGGGIYCHSSSPTITDTNVCGNDADQIFGQWIDGGGVCVEVTCDDNDGDGIPDECRVHDVPWEYPTVQAAIEAAGYGDTVLVAPGTYTSSGGWVINPSGKAITIRATGTAEETILDGEGSRRVVQFAGGEGPDTVIEGFTITGGSADNGGGIYCSGGSPTITDCTISGNTANNYGGGGIYCSGGSPTITGCTISGNTANNYGGGIYCKNSSNPEITNCTISGNTANFGGGINCDGSSPTITGCTISDNTAEGASWGNSGGGIYCKNSSNPTITGCTISNNTANNYGGGIGCAINSNPTIADCTISENTATEDNGGGIYCYSSSPTITGCTISNNTANNSGGGVYCGSSSDPTITDCTISGNTAANDGGGISSDHFGGPAITGCTISNNTAGSYGGGIYVNAATLTDTNVCGNDADQIYGPWIDGGGVCVSFSCDDSDGDGTPDKCQGSIGDGIHEVPSEYATVQAAIEAAGYGDTVLVAPGTYTSSGGWVINPSGKAITIRATGTAEETILDGEGSRRVVQCAGGEGPDTVIEGFTITGGSADNGGGIYCNDSSPTITDCTISGNTATEDNGGGIYCHSSSPTITGCTISNNTANNYGGGIYSGGSSDPTITDCTISNNTATSGGGIYSGGSSDPTITDCTISNNTATSGGGIYSGGGGVYCDSSSSPTITGCTISDNTATNGGGIYCRDYSSPTITDCTISNNTANDDGGGIYCSYSNSSPTLAYTTVCGNAPDQIDGDWTDNGGACVSSLCGDSDGDGTLDCDDACPNDPDNDIDGDGICGDVDACPNDPDNDIDGDGICGDVDACPNDPDNDIDGDGVCGDVDACPNDPDNDIDGDGICGDVDACPNDPDNDIDGDGVCGDIDAFPNDPDESVDSDGDGVGDNSDVFPNDPTEWLDSDNDGIGDNADPCPFWSGSCDNDGSTLYVTTGESINDAIDGVPHEGVVQIMPGTHFIDSPIDLHGRAMTLRAGGASGSVIIDGQGVSAGIQCVSGETSRTLIYGLTIQNCVGSIGGAMLCDASSPIIAMCTITDNEANDGAGVACRNGATLSMIDCVISGNTATQCGGGIHIDSSELTLIACTVSANNANVDGGGICLVDSVSMLRGTTLAGNTAQQNGGGIMGRQSNLSVTNVTIENNFAAAEDGSSATNGGGGVYMDGGDWDIDGCLIRNNFSLANAGGLLSNQAIVTLDHSTVRGNSAATLAGGVYSQGSMYVSNTAICSNTPSEIIGAYVDGGGNSIAILCQAFSAACCLPLENQCLLAEQPDCEYLGGQWLGEGTSCVGDPCNIAPPPWPADVDGNQWVDVGDLLLVIYAWGGQSDSVDINGDGLVSVPDLLMLLEAWGPCE